MSFKDLNLEKSIQDAIDDLGFETPTDIQAQTIPILREHEGDFVGQAQTGTGKTGAFLIPLLEAIRPQSRKVQALILTPTRELANQVATEVERFTKYSKIKSIPIFGGVSYDKQIRGINRDRPEIVVGTPGRMLDLINKKILDLSDVKHFVIDEADEMLKMGFLDEVHEILGHLADERKIWLFSATMPSAIQGLIKKNFTNVKTIRAGKKSLTSENVSQHYCLMQKRFFGEALKRIVDSEGELYGIVFCETKVETNRLFEELFAEGIAVATLHGDLSQYERDRAMDNFRQRKVRLLVCTDVASRGLDVKDITHVFNMGFPRSSDSYVHRIGRTGRAGTKGISVTFITPNERRNLRRVEDLTKSRIEPFELPRLDAIKRKKIAKEMSEISSLCEVVKTKGDEFKVDKSFSSFQEHFDDFDREQLLKLFFSWKFNKSFRKLDNLGELDEKPISRSSGGSRGRGHRGSSTSSNRRNRSRDGGQRNVSERRSFSRNRKTSSAEGTGPSGDSGERSSGRSHYSKKRRFE